MFRRICYGRPYGSPRSESKGRLEKYTVDSRHCGIYSLLGMASHVAVLHLESSEGGDIVTYANDGLDLRLMCKHLFAERHVGILEPVVRFQRLFKPGQAIRKLGIHGIAVGHGVGLNVAMIHVIELCQEFGGAFCPNQVGVGNPRAFTGREKSLATQARLLLMSPASPGREITDPRPFPIPML